MMRSKMKHDKKPQTMDLFDEYEHIMSEQKQCIDVLKEEKFRLEQKIAALEGDRNTVLRVLDITQKNSEEIINQAQLEAKEIILSAHREADLLKNSAAEYKNEILNFEKTLFGILNNITYKVEQLKAKVNTTTQQQGDKTA